MNSLLVALLFAAEPDVAPPPPPPPSQSAPTTLVSGADSGGTERPFRVRVGVLAGMLMQKTQGEVAVAWDFARVHKLIRLVADFTFGFRSTEVSLIPMAGARVLVPIPNDRFEAWVAMLVGANVTFLRGSTAVALPLRFATGACYQVMEKLAVGLEISVEVGPLVAPFTATYTAAHAGAVASWRL